MRKLPTLSALKAFEAAARHLSFKDAANELCVTPAAISHQIHKLEDELQTSLFRRFNRRIALTDSGAKYLVRLSLAFDDMEEATRDLIQKGDGEIIALTAPPMLLKSWIIPKLHSFYQQYPEFRLRLEDTMRYVSFSNDHYDASIRYGFGNWDDVQSEFLFAEDMCPVCSPALLENGKRLSCHEDIENFRLIYTERRLVQWDTYLANSGYGHIKAYGQLWFLNSVHTFEAALAGLGVALVNRVFANKYIKSGELIIPFELEANFGRKPGYYFVSPQHTAGSDKIIAIKNWIREISKELQLN